MLLSCRKKPDYFDPLLLVNFSSLYTFFVLAQIKGHDHELRISQHWIKHNKCTDRVEPKYIFIFDESKRNCFPKCCTRKRWKTLMDAILHGWTIKSNAKAKLLIETCLSQT